MKTPPETTSRLPDKPKHERSVRPAIQFFVWIICLACVGIIVVHQMRSRARDQANSRASENSSGVRPADLPRGATAHSTASQKSAPVFGGGSRPPAIFGKPTLASRELVDCLVYLNSTNRLSGEQAAEWRENLRRLIAQGDQAVPAINEFLEKNQDVVFAREDGGLLGYTSARMALLDVLANIGSPEAMRAMDSVLSSTGSPQEIALVTDFLEKSSPGLYLQHAFDAAQRVLASAASGNLPGVDMAPLFQVFHQYEYGNGFTVPVLKSSASQWNCYAAIALAQLPEGAGVPALISLATGQEGGGAGERIAALQALSGMIPQSADVQDMLLGLARDNRLSSSDWTSLAPFLAGSQMVFQNSTLSNPLSAANPNDVRSTYLPASNQSVYIMPVSSPTPGQIQFIDRLLSITSDPVGIQVLQKSKSTLEGRLSLMARSSGT